MELSFRRDADRLAGTQRGKGMELPAEVKIHNEALGMKGRDGRLIAIHPEGYFEITATLGSSTHRLLMPITTTVLIASEPEQEWDSGIEVER